MRLLLTLFVLLFALPAAAEFTDEEKVEIAKLREGQLLCFEGMTKLAEAKEAGVYRENSFAIVRFQCGNAMRWIQEDLFGLYPERVRDIDAVWDTHMNSFVLADQALRNDTHPLLVEALALSHQARAVFESYNRDLAYADPYPVSSMGHPRQFGPHGHYIKAQQNLARALDYGGTATTGVAGRTANGMSNMNHFMRIVLNAYYTSAHIGVVSESQMRSAVRRDNTIEAQMDMETLRAFHEIQILTKYDPGANGPGANRRLAWTLKALSQTLDGGGNTVEHIGIAWEAMDEWFHNFMAISQPLVGGSGDADCSIDMNGDNVIGLFEFGQVSGHFGHVCGDGQP